VRLEGGVVALGVLEVPGTVGLLAVDGDRGRLPERRRVGDLVEKYTMIGIPTP